MAINVHSSAFYRLANESATNTFTQMLCTWSNKLHEICLPFVSSCLDSLLFWSPFCCRCCCCLSVSQDKKKMRALEKTYPMSGLAPARSWLFDHVSVTLFSVTFTTRGVPGIDGNVLGSGVRCRFTLPLFSTCENTKRGKKIVFDYFVIWTNTKSHTTWDINQNKRNNFTHTHMHTIGITPIFFGIN